MALRYDEYDVKDSIEFDINSDIRFTINRLDYNRYGYDRYEHSKHVMSKIIAYHDTLKVGVYPIAPTNIPNRYAEHAMIILEEQLIVSPRSSIECYLKMPIEVGVVALMEDPIIVDSYSLGYTKYALYGLPERGIICRYYKSKVYLDIPKVKHLQEAIVPCIFRNYSNSSKIINRVVFPIKDRDLYYDQSNAYFDRVEMVLQEKLGRDVAEVNVIDAEWNAKRARIGKAYSNRYIMEWGF